MDHTPKKRRFSWLRTMPPIFSLILVVAFGIIFYKIIQEIDLSAVHFSKLISILSPFFIGLIIAFFLVQPVKFLEKLFQRNKWIQKHPKLISPLSILISYLLIFGLLALVLIYIVPQIFSGLSTLITLLIDSINQLYSNLGSFLESWDESSWSSLLSSQDINQFLSNQLTSISSGLQSLAATVLPMVYNTVTSIASGSINFIVGFIVSIYVISDRRRLSFGGKRMLYAIFREDHANTILNFSQDCMNVFRRFFVGKALDSLIIGILCYILMKIFRLPYAELISLIVGITNVIPYFGPFIGAIPSILIILMVSPMDALIFTILILALQQVDGNIIGPAILGNSLGLKPIWIIFSVTIGTGLFGITGMLFGVPTFTVIYTMIHRILQRRLQRKNLSTPEELEAVDKRRTAAQEAAATAPDDKTEPDN